MGVVPEPPQRRDSDWCWWRGSKGWRVGTHLGVRPRRFEGTLMDALIDAGGSGTRGRSHRKVGGKHDKRGNGGCLRTSGWIGGRRVRNHRGATTGASDSSAWRGTGAWMGAGGGPSAWRGTGRPRICMQWGSHGTVSLWRAETEWKAETESRARVRDCSATRSKTSASG